jgi:LemA protein
VKALIIVLVILVLGGLMVGGKFVSIRNDLATQKEDINRSWSDIDADLQRRADLIPNLVETVKGYAKEETGVMETIAQSRSAMLNAQTPQQKIDAYNQMNSALGRLLVVVENYPNLKANQNFQSLQFQLEGTENRILQARRRYNEAIQRYNTTLSLFPNNIVAALSGYTRNDAYFKTDVSARSAPAVKF